jgi:hypothetical protein
MSIEKYISELLFEHDCVIVPEFGGFVCNYSSAGINPSKHQFHPPFKKISFNRNLKNNDGLLANQIVQAKGISYADSNSLISEYVDSLKADLSLHKRFELNNIGTFYIGEENTLLFEQDETVNYLQDSFGLSVFSSPAIRREPIERKIEKKLKDKVIIPSKERTEEALPSKKRATRYFVAAAAVLMISFLIWLPLQTGVLKNMDYSSLNPFAAKSQPLYKFSEAAFFPGPDNNASKDNITGLIAMASDTIRYLNIMFDGKIPIVVQLQEDATAVVKTKNKEKGVKTSFHIVGGAFAVPENAEKFCKKLISLGYNAKILNSKNKSIRFVSYGGFSTREEALQAIDKIRAVQGDVWLMTN